MNTQELAEQTAQEIYDECGLEYLFTEDIWRRLDAKSIIQKALDQVATEQMNKIYACLREWDCPNVARLIRETVEED